MFVCSPMCSVSKTMPNTQLKLNIQGLNEHIKDEGGKLRKKKGKKGEWNGRRKE